MITNFDIEDNIAVHLNGEYFDLHNNFDFIGLTKERDSISADFEQTSGDWVKTDEFRKLTFEFKNVSYEYYENGDIEALKTDAKNLAEITFFPAYLREINDGMLLQSKPKKDDDLILFFEDGRVIRIGCDSILLTVGNVS